jgi:hypothetical protein
MRASARKHLCSLCLLLCSVLLLQACAGGAPRQGRPVSGGPEVVVRSYVQAFNAHDAAAVGRLLAEDLSWLAIDGDQLREEARGRSAMVEWLTAYFAQFPDVRAELRYLSGGQRFVAVHECLSWRGSDGPQRQCAHGSYEVVDGQIRRVWYWPAD